MATPRKQFDLPDPPPARPKNAAADGRPRSLAQACSVVEAALRDGHGGDRAFADAMRLLDNGGWQGDDDAVAARAAFQRLCVEALAAGRAQRELSRASALQSSWSPGAETLSASGYQIAGWVENAGLCGGDMCDVRRLDNGGLLITVGDATGSGADGAMVVAAARGALGVAWRMLRQRPLVPADVLHVMNSAVYEVGQGHVTMTCSAAVLHPDGTLLASGASHPLPYLIKADGSLSAVSARGPRLGAPEARYHNVKTTLDAGDSLCVLTDGVTECRDRMDVEFGNRRLRQFLEVSAAVPVGAARDRLRSALMNHRRGQTDRDDFAFVYARRQ